MIIKSTVISSLKSDRDIQEWGTVCGSGRWHFLEYENKTWKQNEKTLEEQQGKCSDPTVLLQCLAMHFTPFINSGRFEDDGGTAE